MGFIKHVIWLSQNRSSTYHFVSLLSVARLWNRATVRQMSSTCSVHTSWFNKFLFMWQCATNLKEKNIVVHYPVKLILNEKEMCCKLTDNDLLHCSYPQSVYLRGVGHLVRPQFQAWWPAVKWGWWRICIGGTFPGPWPFYCLSPAEQHHWVIKKKKRKKEGTVRC